MKHYPPAIYGFLAALVYACLVMWIATVTHRCADRAHMTTIPQTCGGHFAEAFRR